MTSVMRERITEITREETYFKSYVPTDGVAYIMVFVVPVVIH